MNNNNHNWRFAHQAQVRKQEYESAQARREQWLVDHDPDKVYVRPDGTEVPVMAENRKCPRCHSGAIKREPEHKRKCVHCNLQWYTQQVGAIAKWQARMSDAYEIQDRVGMWPMSRVPKVRGLQQWYTGAAVARINRNQPKQFNAPRYEVSR